MEIVSQTELVSINATMLVQVMSFLIFLVIITRIMFKPLRRTMEDRSAHIKQLQHEMVLQEKKLNEISAALAKEEKSLKAEAFLESEQRESSAKEEAQVLLGQAREEIMTQQQKATEEIQGRIGAAREQLANEAEPLIRMIMEKILGRGVQP
jgi:F-type H+-transporting ATPase subunit b